MWLGENDCYWVLNGIGALWGWDGGGLIVFCLRCVFFHLMVGALLAAPPSLDDVLTRLYTELMSPLTVTRSSEQ